MKLAPPELGEMHVDVMVRGQQVGVRLEVENTPARAILVGELPALQELLEGRGFTVESAEVILHDGHGDASQREASWGAGGGSAQEGAEETLAPEDEPPTGVLDIEV